MKPTQYDLHTSQECRPEKGLLAELEQQVYHLIKEGEVPPWFHDFAFVGDVTHWSGSRATDSQPLYRIVSDDE